MNRTGFSLAEAMMATVVLAIAAAGVLVPFTSGAAARVEGTRRTLTARLAADLIEQIVSTPFDQIVASYNGYSEPEGAVTDAEGVVFTDSNYARLSRAATCEYVYMPQESGSAQAKFILVTVTVYYNGRQTATLNRLISQ